MKIILSILALSLSASAFADYKLSKNGKKVLCFADDNISVTLNASRKTLKYVVEGESSGPQKIKKTVNNGLDSVTYIAEEFSLTLSNKGDSMLFSDGSEPIFFNECN